MTAIFKMASKTGGTFARLILGIGIRASVSVKPAHEFPPAAFLFLRRFRGVDLLQKQGQLPMLPYAALAVSVYFSKAACQFTLNTLRLMSNLG